MKIRCYSQKDQSRDSSPRCVLAFTLIEILFATAAFAIILLVMKMTFSSALSLRNKTHRLTEFENKVHIALNILKKDLEGVITTEIFAPEFLSESVGGPGQSGRALEFYTTTGLVSDFLPWGDIQKVTYSVNQEGLAFAMAPQTNQLGQFLVRELRRDVTIDIDENESQTLILDRVESLTFEFFDGVTWVTTWDSNTSEPVLPEAIRATLLLHTVDSKFDDQRFITRDLVVPIFVEGFTAEEEAEEEDTSGGGTNQSL